MIIFSVLTANVGGLNLIFQNQLAILSSIQLYGAPAVAAVPQAIVASAAIRRFIVDQQHILLQAVHLCFHSGMDIFLPYVPDYFLIVLLKGERGFYHQVKL